jgi:hypothetical protein
MRLPTETSADVKIVYIYVKKRKDDDGRLEETA